MTKEDEKYMLIALDLARAAADHGNQPFGALVVMDGKIITQAESTKITTQDISRHSELTVATRVAMMLDKEELKRCTLYTSTEPCAMCTGSIYWAGIGRMVYGCPNEDLGRISGDNLGITSREVLSTGTRKVEVVGPVLKEEAIKIHEDYWEKPREWWKGD